MTIERAQRGWFWGGLAFAFGGMLCLGVSIFGWVTVGFMVQDNTTVHDTLRGGEQGTKDALLKIADELKLKREQDAKIYGIPNPK